ncbi:hypothetical protein HY409_02060 [Candidatus Gottesmanbacteria bacterium]|nr:hypothetical protein [Candidatus Gottesmanbacteria bacterium]
MNIFIIIPTIRNLSFLEEWNNEFDECHLIIGEDHAKKEIKTPKKRYQSVHHCKWEDIQTDFGKDEWIFSRKNAGIRSYGFWKAYRLGADIIITLDDDCYPVEIGFVSRHVQNLSLKAPQKWATTFPTQILCIPVDFHIKYATSTQL